MSNPPRLPNILLIQADQMSVRCMPFHGNAVVQAPAMARLAQEGVIFDAMYCNYPLCAPSRASMLSGRIASSIGCYDNGAELAASVPTVAHYLRALDYQTCLSGKMHFLGPDQLHGFEERLTTDIYPSDFGWTADWRRVSTGTGEMRVVAEAGPCKRSVQMDFDDEVAFKANRWLSSYARSARRAPFFLVASFSHPHDPFSIATRYWNRYSHENIDMPSLPIANDPHSQRLRRHFGMDTEAPTPAQIRNARRAYYGSISYIDDKVSELLQSLEECGLSDDTVVILTSDHGEFLGERGLWFKRSFFEESVRVPFVVHAPRRWRPGRVVQPCSLLDLLPTMVDWGAPDGGHKGFGDAFEGSSLMPLLEGREAPRDVFSEVMAEATPAPLLMVRRGNFKYIHCELDPPQLFDLSTDPIELRNLADDPDHSAVVARLHEVMLARWNPAALADQVRESQVRRKAVTAALNRGRTATWDYAPPNDADSAYYRNSLAFDPSRLLKIACLRGVVVLQDGVFACGAQRLGATQAEAIAAIASDLDLANAIVRSIEEAKSFLR